MKLPPAFGPGKQNVFVVIETPRGSGNKYDYDQEMECFRLGKCMPAGTIFPVDFGFIPGTKGEDGDPLDVMVFMEHPSFTGCIIECRIIGVLKIRQRSKGEKWIRNDRFLAVPADATDEPHMRKLSDIPAPKLNELAGFLNYYKQVRGSSSEWLGTRGRAYAMKKIRQQLL